MGRGAIRKPRAVLVVWAVALLLLGGLGAGVEQRLTRSDLTVPGTGSAAALELTKKHFGESHTLIVLLEGPRAEVDEQGRAISATLDRSPDMAVVGPWSQGASKELRPDGDKALVLVRVDRPFEEVSEDAVPHVRAEVARAVSDPVKSSVTGYADVANGVHTQSVEALKRAEIIAAPVLLIVLLLVFRSVVAAVLPLAMGLLTIGVSRGVIDLVNRVHEVDVVALNMASMMGLALGVDYSLVLVSRFREELAEGHAPRVAARRATGTAGRTVIYAGAALIAAMAAGLFVAPGNLMVSSSVGVLAAVIVSVLAAASALPATLALLGRNVDRWRFGNREEGESRWGGLALRAISRPVVAAALVLGVLAVLSAPALALNLGPPDPRNLPEDAVERRDFMHVSEALEMGWGAPYEIVVATDNGRITDPEKLEALDAFQAKLADDPDIAAVMGPAPIARGARRLDKFQRGLENAKSQLTRAQRDQDRLVRGLTQVDEELATATDRPAAHQVKQELPRDCPRRERHEQRRL
jgi:RND superfamily putative drug exporter